LDFRRTESFVSEDQAAFHKGSARMFESDFLERFSHVHPATPLFIFVPIILACLGGALFAYRVPPFPLLGYVAAGYMVWTLIEYWLHRLVFHMPVRGRFTARIYFFLHGVHHDWPWDSTRLVMPPSVSLSLGVIFYVGVRALLAPASAHAVFAGMAIGYLAYDMIHWYTHAGAPKTRWMRFLRRQHMMHHFKEPGTRFGVSCPWWDFVFGTSGH
jgi:sterol desaturase/sphingolipid hydroxylase (fatty acid hydroxylase superfamily)